MNAPNQTVARRLLTFQTFDEAIADARRLQGGYARAGNWTLGQCADHLSKFMRYSLERFPTRFRLPGPATWLVRRVLLSEKRLSKPMPSGMPTARFLKPGETADSEAVEAFIVQCRRVEAHAGEFCASPIFGKMPPDLWRRVHLNHAAHHLGFLVPSNEE